VAALGFAALLLGGCASSLPEVRESSPLRAATITAERSTLASCIVSGLRAADPGTIRLLAGSLIYQTEEGATSTEIIGYGPAPAGGFMPVYMLTLTTAGPEVAIQSRRNWKGNIDPIDRQAWPVIERCAGAKVNPTPPLDN